MTEWYQWHGDDLIISCRLQPKSSNDEIVGPHGEALKIRITAPPIDGKANAHLIKFLAKAFGVSRSQVTIEHGDLGRNKRIRIAAPDRFPAKLNINKP